MIDLSAVDLEMLVEAIDDNSYESSWWLNPETGEIEYCGVDDDYDEFEARNLVYIQPGDSHAAYRDMVKFTYTIDDTQIRHRLERALEGRGAFRRFRDILYDHDQLRLEWFTFRDHRTKRRAIHWLASADLVSDTDADQAIANLNQSH